MCEINVTYKEYIRNASMNEIPKISLRSILGIGAADERKCVYLIEEVKT